MMPYSITLVLLCCVLLTAARIARPHDPNEPINYPEDYCEKIQQDETFDFVVIGAGPAGCTVSRRLAENRKIKVLLLEAGGDPIPSSDLPTGRGVTDEQLWEVYTEPSDRQCAGFDNKTCKYMLGKFLGGASVVNLMMYDRGNPEDYKEWGSKKGCKGWDWNTMLKFFKKLENFQDPLHLVRLDMPYHNTGGPFTTSPSQIDPQSHEFRQAFQAALMKLKVPYSNDFNGNHQVGVGQVTALLGENGYRENAAKAYLLNIPDNMKVCKGAIVNRVIMKNKKVTGVEYTHNQGEAKVVMVAKDAILSAGAISSPQILERSGIGGSFVLNQAGVDVLHEMPGVGANIQEQFANLGCAFQIDFKTSAPRNPLSIALTSMTMFLNMSDYNDPVPDVQWLFVPYNPLYMRFNEKIAKQFSDALKDSFVFMAGSEVLRQSNRGYIHIKGTDPTQSPAYNPSQFTSAEEAELTTKSCQLIRKAMEDFRVQKFNPRPIILDECKKHKYNSEEEIMCAARLVAFPAYHMAGGAVMGEEKDKNSVVDNRLRVHGIKGLRVADLSVMPDVPRGNTEVPSIAIGERAADIIKSDHGIRNTIF